MTVAAVVLVPDPAAALSDADGEPALRRVLQAAWAGGAIPLVVVTHPNDAGTALKTEMGGFTTVLVQPEDVPPGSAWFGRGLRAAADAVVETGAALLWPFRFTWVDPETVTSLIEAHGAEETGPSIIRPAFRGQPGFPILVPRAFQARFEAERELHGFQLVERLATEGVPSRVLETGDPGVVFDRSTSYAELAAYQGPPEPAGGPPAEWNEALAKQAEDRSPREQ